MSHPSAIVTHILPKANQIVDTAQQDFKSIYPFKLSKIKHIQSCLPQKLTQNYQKKNISAPFKPIKKQVKQHFNIKKYIIYDKFNQYNLLSQQDIQQQSTNINTYIFSIQKLKNLRNNDFIIPHELIPNQKQQTQNEYSQNNNLIFDSKFECGNLNIVSKIQQQYFLLLNNDINTSGYTNWFYFKVIPLKIGKYKFNILNYGKAGWSFNLGTGICTKIHNKWTRSGQNITCQPNSKLFSQKDQYRKFNTLSFQFEFKDLQEVYFSYNIPYSYTDLLTTLDEIQRQNYTFYTRKLAGTTICGNRIEMLTIGNFNNKNKSPSFSMSMNNYCQQQGQFQSQRQTQNNQQQAIVLIARSHPGQTVSSWIIHYFIKFLLSQNIQARILREKFIFKIFPMINPDGVIHGNYRCSLVGRDLNRRWNKSIKQLYPQIYYIKNQIIQLSQRKSIRMILDLHGHTQKKNSFFFGCNDRTQPHKCRLFPYLMSKLSENYDYSSCNFHIDKQKISTARITLFMLFKNINCQVFTLQTSQFGIKNSIINNNSIKNISICLIKGIFYYFKLNKFINLINNTNIKNNINNNQVNYINTKIDKNSINLNSHVKYQQKQEKYQQQSQQQQNIKINQQQLQYQHQHQSQNQEITQKIQINLFDMDKIQKQILQNSQLLKLGNQKDDGSDSQPSICNINFQNLKKMSNKKQTQSLIKHKNNTNHVLYTKKLQQNKKSIDYLPSDNKNKQLPKRFASTSHSFRKNSQDSTLFDNHNINRLTRFNNTSHTNAIKKSKSKVQSSCGLSTPLLISKNTKNNPHQLVKMINFQLSFEGFDSHRSSIKKKYRSTTNQLINSILDVKLNKFANVMTYTQPSINRPYSYLYKNKK